MVAIHGRKDRDDPKTVSLGGHYIGLRDKIATALEATNFATRAAKGPLTGTDLSNICNRGRRREGVQLELPRTLRGELQKTQSRLRDFSNAIRRAIESVN